MKLRKSNQGGWIVFLVILALLGISLAVFSDATNYSAVKLSRREATISSLAKAKQALLAYTISRDDGPGAARPGEFPCPTADAPNTPSYGLAASGCTTIKIGRLPWKTLGIPELFDGSGEPLWYALSSKFTTTITHVNNGSRGDITLYGADGITPEQTEVVAVIFSSGAPIGNQNRSPTDLMTCAATSALSVARNLCPDNYLDAASGRNNASNEGPFIAAVAGKTFNDDLVYITTGEFMPRIEQRIAKMLTRMLKTYYSSNSYYPYAANYADATQTLRTNQANCEANTFSGRFPENVSGPAFPPVSNKSCTGLQEWPVGLPDALPDWYFGNRWNLSTYYAVGKAYVKNGTNKCLNPGDCLTVDGESTIQAVLILPGTPTSAQVRPNYSPVQNLSAGLNISNYFEKSANQQGWATADDYVYESVTSNLPSRDLVILIKN